MYLVSLGTGEMGSVTGSSLSFHICSNGAELVYWNIIFELGGLMPKEFKGGTGQYYLLAGTGTTSIIDDQSSKQPVVQRKY